jgi:hypothetical protein
MNELPLKDIHLPDVSLWWPPAPGWWVILISVILIFVFMPKFLRWLRWKPVKKLSLRELDRIRIELDNGVDDQKVAQQISTLLRRTVISYRGRAVAASTTGESWMKQLKQLSGEECFTPEQDEWLRIGQYQPSVRCEMQAMLQSCENWIKALPRRNPDAAD